MLGAQVCLRRAGKGLEHRSEEEQLGRLSLEKRRCRVGG